MFSLSRFFNTCSFISQKLGYIFFVYTLQIVIFYTITYLYKLCRIQQCTQQNTTFTLSAVTNDDLFEPHKGYGTVITGMCCASSPGYGYDSDLLTIYLVLYGFTKLFIRYIINILIFY